MRTNILLSKLNFDANWAKTAIGEELVGHKKVLVMPFSYWDSEVYDLDSWNNVYRPNRKYFEEIYAPFSSYGYERNQFKYINFFCDSQDDIKKDLLDAEVLFLTGGAPDLFMERIMAKGILPYIKSFDGVVVGCSAGVMIQFDKFHITPGPLYPDYKVINGIGMVDMDMGIEVHYASTVAQLESIEKTKTEYSSLLLLDNESASIVKDNKIQLLGNAKIIKR